MGVVIGGWATWRRERGMSVHGQVRVWTGRRRYYCHGAVVPFGQARLCLVTRAAATLIHRRLRVQQSEVGRRHSVSTVSWLPCDVIWYRGRLTLYRVMWVALLVVAILQIFCWRGWRCRWCGWLDSSGIAVVLSLSQQHALDILPHLEPNTQLLSSSAMCQHRAWHRYWVTSLCKMSVTVTNCPGKYTASTFRVQNGATTNLKEQIWIVSTLQSLDTSQDRNMTAEDTDLW